MMDRKEAGECNEHVLHYTGDSRESRESRVNKVYDCTRYIHIVHRSRLARKFRDKKEIDNTRNPCKKCSDSATPRSTIEPCMR